jgi:DNA-binding MarR family transcriptional regulator
MPSDRLSFEQADALNRAIRLIGMKHRGRATLALARLGLHPGQELLLLELDARGPRTQTQLAAAIGCEPPSVTVMVQKLEARGIVTRHQSPADARATVVDLTAGGRALLPRLKNLWHDLAESAVAGLIRTNPADALAVMEEVAASLYPARPHPATPREAG